MIDRIEAKGRLHRELARIATASEAERRTLLPALFEEGAVWHGPHPINDLNGLAALDAGLWAPLREAFPDLERRDDIVAAGTWQDGEWVVLHGHYHGTFAASWLGIEPNRQLIAIHYGEYYRIGASGRIAEAYVLFDILDVLRQAGRRVLPVSPGAEGIYPGPATVDGLMLGPTDPAESARTMEVLLGLFEGLRAYDGKTLESMRMERCWTPGFNWYGPCGIGSMRGVAGFQAYHQRPFLTAFPDRKGAGHKARIVDGAYACSTGWPSVVATHAGPYLGVPATNRRIGMRVMDIWRREGDVFAENWVFIDLPELFLQFGVDLLAK